MCQKFENYLGCIFEMYSFYKKYLFRGDENNRKKFHHLIFLLVTSNSHSHTRYTCVPKVGYFFYPPLNYVIKIVL